MTMNKRTYKLIVFFLLFLLVSLPLLRLLAKRPRPSVQSDSLAGKIDKTLIATVAASQAHLSLTWQERDRCRTAVLDAKGVTYGPCHGELISVSYLRPSQAAVLIRQLTTYASFSAKTAAGTVTFTGLGNRQATPSEQKDIAMWARLTVDEVGGRETGKS